MPRVFGRQRRGRVPPLDPAGPGVRCARRSRPARQCTPARAAARRARAPPGPGGCRRGLRAEYRPMAGSARNRASVSPDRSSSSGLRLSSSTWQMTAVSSGAAALVTPAGQHVAGPAARRHRLGPGRTSARPATGGGSARSRSKRGEPAQQAGIGEQVGPRVGADLARATLPELLVAVADQAGPVLRGPRPSTARCSSPHRMPGPARPRRGRTAAGGACPDASAARTGQRRAAAAASGSTARAAAPGSQPSRRSRSRAQGPQAVELGRGEFSLPAVAAPASTGQGQAAAAGGAGDDRRRMARSVGAAWPAASMRVSASTRQAWMWSIDLLSLSARSRPDRWI